MHEASNSEIPKQIWAVFPRRFGLSHSGTTGKNDFQQNPATADGHFIQAGAPIQCLLGQKESAERFKGF